MSQETLRHLPSVGQLLEHPRIAPLLDGPARDWVTRLVQRVVDAERERLRSGGAGADRDVLTERLAGRISDRHDALLGPAMRRVINATGVVVHTNLGRSLYPQRAAAWMTEAALHNCDLEMDLEAGRRGHRGRGVEEKLALLTGADDALVVNNNASALFLAVRGAAAGGRVILSRGEVVAIGGSFKLHTIIAETGCELVEVGTTNRTTVADYAEALCPGAVVLKVHRSNFDMTGFTETASLSDLGELCRERGHVLIYDAGSGLFERIDRFGLPAEPVLADDLAAGADLVTCSGDKLFGGNQAGVILGRADLVASLRSHPMRRVLRVDKTALAALDGVATHYLAGDHLETVPTLVHLGRTADELAAAADRLGHDLAGDLPEGWEWTVMDAESQVGGGAGSTLIVPSRLLLWRGPEAELERCHRLLRTGEPAVVGRISQEGLALDLRAVPDDELDDLAAAVRAAWSGLKPAAEEGTS